MPKAHRFEVEYAKSSMATCRVCMAKIPKGALRIGHFQDEQLENDATVAGPPRAADAGNVEGGPAKEDKRMMAVAAAARWHHFECFNKMKGTRWMAANLPASPGSLKGFGELLKRDQKKLQALWKAILGSGAPSPGGAAAKVSGKRKAAASTSSGGTAQAAPAAKIAKLTSVQGVLKAKDFLRVQKLERELASKTQAQLGAELAKNKQVRSGKKDELVRRVAEGRLLGALPPCPRCTQGQIHWSRVGGWYSCPGYFDKEANARRRCNFRSKELQRGKWQSK
mmetsp:Transcript_41002/g.130295  ORF Transcript_41002/g.130295 Transcript_41002/m.130295 type:complete len:281 (-) Transcript_41002:126-968(-)